MPGRIIDDPAERDIAAIGADRAHLIRLVVLEQQRLRICVGPDLIEIEETRIALVGLDEEGLAIVRPVDEARDMAIAGSDIAGCPVALAGIDMRKLVAALIARDRKRTRLDSSP